MTSPVHSRRRERLLFAAILVLALALRVWDLNARSLWFDEAGEYWVSTAPFSHLVESVRTGTGDPPLYEFLLHMWMQVSTNETWLRLLTVFASVSGVAGVMVFTRTVTAGAVAPVSAVAPVFAGALLAVLPADVRYAQEAGQYGFVPALVAWNLVCLLWMMRARNWRSLFAWVVTALAASYLYYATIFPVASAFACVVIESIARRDVRLRRATGTALVIYVAGMLPLVVSYLPTQLARVVEYSGIERPSSAGIVGIMRDKWRMTCELIAFQFTGWPHTHIPAVVSVLPVLLLMVVAIPRAPRLLIWFAVAINAYAAANALGMFPIGYRWGLIMTPLIICAIATGAAATGKKWLRPATLAAFALLVAACVYSLPNRSLRDRVYPEPSGAWPETEDMRMVAQFWLQHRTTAQPTYVYYGAAPAFAYYTREPGTGVARPSTWCLACWHDWDTPAFCRDGNIYYGRWMRRFDANEKMRSVVETLGGVPPSFWMVFGHLVPGDDRDMIAGFKREGYRVAASVEGVNASACLLTREP
jgi:hypothetical protein